MNWIELRLQLTYVHTQCSCVQSEAVWWLVLMTGVVLQCCETQESFYEVSNGGLGGVQLVRSEGVTMENIPAISGIIPAFVLICLCSQCIHVRYFTCVCSQSIQYMCVISHVCVHNPYVCVISHVCVHTWPDQQLHACEGRKTMPALCERVSAPSAGC